METSVNSSDKVRTVLWMTKQLPSAHPNTAIRTRDFLGWFRMVDVWSSTVQSGDFPLFPHMKTWLATQCFDNDDELHAGVRVWLNPQAETFYDD
ncbi:hypothetical protein AVEN_205919-1 [Araneus ventricosus]|uniref:Uncharacterized protein n=1 Tax=Araneus ventricosus TaxID=182803 RepID=A0A4Y2HHH3_ARAVE|nr:hypothetical protein AVEN_205919-1 [Araneus ventricosus]